VLVVVFRQHQVELQAAVIGESAPHARASGR
jgi:hypothetical protein